MPTVPEFTHLHVHSEYSLLDGLSRIPDLVAEAKRQGMRSLALTDHGVLSGAIEFYEEARQQGIKPIIGVEAYVAPRRMADREAADRSAFHLVLLAKDQTGYRNLLALSTKAQLDGFYYKPRIDHEVLAQHSEGLIALSGCGSGEVPSALRNGNAVGARHLAAFYRDLFGPENYYLELQSHGLDFQPEVNRGILELAKELDLAVVCTNDSHYIRKEDWAAQDLLLCIQTNALMDDPKRLKFYTGEHYLKSAEEMDRLFGSERPDALANTMALAERCNLELAFDRLDFPELPFVPEGDSPDEFLARMCWEQLPRRYPRVTADIEDRLRYELEVVRSTGFAPYILFVWDFVDYARRRGILCGPRGSAAGSIILYCLGITTIDPIAHGLTFERFLNPERTQMPDIDMDFADSRRDEVIEYVAERYGRDRVAQIVTFGRLLARAAVRDVGRALGYPLSEVDRVAKLIPTLPLGMTLDRALADSPELKQLYDEQEHVRRLVDSARQVEGIARHASTHAAGIVVSSEPLTRHVPLQRGARGENITMTQYEMHALETIGLLKMDFLGLTNLTLLENALGMVEETRGIRLDLQGLPTDDPETFQMLSNGDSTGVFQLEGAGMRRTLREFRPSSVDHLAAIVALYRPGPMAHIPTYVAAKDGRQPITYLHPKLEPLLRETYGVIVYQDQVLQIVQAIAGFTLGQADILRRAMGKKIPSEMKRERDNFLEGAQRNGVDPEVASKIWEYIEPFAGYAFNRAHAYCYAYIAYQTAYLKRQYPAEYMAATLTTQSGDTDKVAAAAGECKRLGIPLLPPDINRSGVAFSVEGAGDQGPGAGIPDPRPPAPSPQPLAVRFGLGAVRNVGEGAARMMVAERQARGPYGSLDDLCARLDLRTVNKRVLEALTKAGALQALGPPERILAGLDRTMAAAGQLQRAAEVGQQSLFDLGAGLAEPNALPAAPAPSERQRLGWEKEAFGFFLSNHPFEAAAGSLSQRITLNTSQISEEMRGERVTLAGAIMRVRRVVTRKRETMVVAQIEDLHGAIDAVVFPRTYAANPDVWREDNVVIVKGRIATRRAERLGEDEAPGIPEVLVETVEEWVPGADPGGPPIRDAPPPDQHDLARDPVETAAGSDPAEEAAEPSMPEIEPTDPVEGVRDWGLGIGKQDLTADEPWPPPPSPQPLALRGSESTGRQIAVLFRETGDPSADKDRLCRLHTALNQCTGHDPYLIIFEGDHGRRQLVGEHLRLKLTAELVREVEAILGSGTLQVMAS